MKTRGSIESLATSPSGGFSVSFHFHCGEHFNLGTFFKRELLKLKKKGEKSD